MKPAFVDGWESTGATVEVFYYNRGVIRHDFSPDGEAAVHQMNTEMVQKARGLASENRLDLIFFSILDDYITVNTLRQLKKLDVPLVNYHADMGYLWYRLLKTGKYFDLICCAQTLYMEEYKRRGFRTLYLPFGSNDRWEGKTTAETTWPDIFEGVRYLGSPIVDRPKMLAHLYFNEVPVEIYGNHWNWYPRTPLPEAEIRALRNGFRLPGIKIGEKGWHDNRHYFFPRLRGEGYSFVYGLGLKLQQQWFPQPVYAEAFYHHLPPAIIKGEYDETDFVKLVRTAAINLGFTHLHKRQGPHRHQKQIRLRDVEIPMTGGFLLTEACSETENYYQPGKHLDTFTGEDDLLEKARWYLAHPSERERIARDGRAYGLAHHTWKHRFHALLKVLKIENSVKQ
jgi:hypothetical protein